MGLRVRKTKKLGPARVTLSKSGIGYSVGTKGFRVTQKANGGTRTTASIPGTGISSVKDTSATHNDQSSTKTPDSKTCLGGCSIVLCPLLIVIAIASLKDYPALSVILSLALAAIMVWGIYRIVMFRSEEKTKTQNSLSAAENQMISSCITQIKESANLVNNTTTPDVFFGRLKFIIESLMFLQQYEGKYDFGASTPTNDLDRLLSNIEQTVRDFTQRTYSKHLASAAELKTERGRTARMQKCFAEMETAFLNSDSYWSGDSVRPHYEGELYTDVNMEELQKLYNGTAE